MWCSTRTPPPTHGRSKAPADRRTEASGVVSRLRNDGGRQTERSSSPRHHGRRVRGRNFEDSPILRCTCVAETIAYCTCPAKVNGPLAPVGLCPATTYPTPETGSRRFLFRRVDGWLHATTQYSLAPRLAAAGSLGRRPRHLPGALLLDLDEKLGGQQLVALRRHSLSWPRID